MRPKIARMRQGAFLAGIAVAVLAAACPTARAFTDPRDIAALWRFKEEALKMSNNNGSWRKVFESWTGRGEECPYPECPHDPCGEDWHGAWEGVQCRELQGVKQWTLPEDVPRRVTNLHIPEWGLPGSLPESLCLFEMIEEIDFDENEFEGTLPACIGCLKHLREIDIEDNKFTGTIPKEWGNLVDMIEFEIDGNQLLAGCIPEGMPKDAEWCGDCWSTCPAYDPYCGAYDCNSCVSWTTDPEIGTSYENTRITGERCPSQPNPPICAWEIFHEEFAEEQKKLAQQKKEALDTLQTKPQFEIRSRENTVGQLVTGVTQPEDIEAAPSVVETPSADEAVVESVIVETNTTAGSEESGDAVEEQKEEAPLDAIVCPDAPKRTTIFNEECVFPMEIMGQVHCDCATYMDSKWCTTEGGMWRQCAEEAVSP